MEVATLGNFIRALREEKAITQKDLARRIGVTTKLIQMWERGVCAPRVDKIPELASALNIQVTELLLAKRLPKGAEVNTEQVLSIYSEITAVQLKIETKYRWLQLMVVTTLSIILGIFLIDNLHLALFITAIVPILAAISFVASTVAYFMFRHTNRNSRLPIVAGTISFFIFALILCLFVFAFYIGGPKPT